MKRRLQYSLYAIVAAGVVAYGIDDVVARVRKDEFSTVKVDQVYAITNRWNKVDYSIGNPQQERCVNALFPHSGSAPCWYVNGHTLRYIRAGN
ncbi:MAG TPA: hypothetical protein VEF06_04265 [Bryobacteraceae bacterium]|nr:hypothetical protein [Bryobacteraceae bacterium]